MRASLRLREHVPAAGGAGPGGEALVDFRVFPMADHDLARQAQARADVTELAAAVGGLVQVHEIHVDVRPRDVAVELGVQVGQRLAEDLQAFDPHLRRGKRVHPGDDADAVFLRVRIDGELGDFGGGLEDRLENHLVRQRAGGVERLDDDLRVLIDFFERLGSVEVLGAGDEPDFKGVELN